MKVALDNMIIKERQGGINRDYVNLACTRGVTNSDYNAVIEGLVKIIRESGLELKIASFKSQSYKSCGNYSSPDWYQNESLTNVNKGHGLQVSGSKLMNLLMFEPQQESNPHYDFFVCDKDLRTSATDASNNFIYGQASYPLNLISTKRINDYINNPSIRARALALITAHEFGHTLGLVYRDVNQHEKLGGHCKGERGACVMEQVNVSGCKDLSTQVKLVYPNAYWLCLDCREEVRIRKRELAKHGAHY